jgi:N-acetylneuraminic acid mutarotase
VAFITSLILTLFLFFGVSCEDDEEPNDDASISGFTPQQGGEGDLVTITGQNFPEKKEQLRVKFGNYLATIESATTTALLVRLPTVIHECDEVIISVEYEATEFTSPQKFNFACPTIESFSPANGDIGEIITINGTYFTAEPNRIKVTVGTGLTEVIASSPSKINVKLLDGYAGGYPLKVEIDSKTVTSSSLFKINGPVITGFSPVTAKVCENITVTGTDFSPVASENKVLFGFKEGVVVSATTEQLIVAPPYDIAGIAGNPVNITVTVDEKTGISAGSITITETSWNEAASLENIGRWQGIGFSIGEKGYAGTGSVIVDGLADLRKDFWEYDLTSNTWTKKADLPGLARLGAIGFSIEGKGYVGLGGDHQNELLNDFWEFDPGNNSWLQMPDFPGAKRSGGIAFSIDGMGYVGAGWGFESTSDIWKFDPVNKTWTKETDYPGDGTSGMVCFAIGDKAYIGTGLLTNDFWEYTPATKQWRKLNNFPEPFIHYGVSFALENYGIAGTGGGPNGDRTDHLWKYDPSTDQWSRLPDFRGGVRNFAVGFPIGRTFLIGTGSTSFNIDQVNDFYVYGCD